MKNFELLAFISINVFFKLCTHCTLYYFICLMLSYVKMIMTIRKICMTNVSIKNYNLDYMFKNYFQLI